MLHLNSLSLANYRCFSKCEISFDEQLTVLVARNGQGKSGILDAIAILFEPFFNTLTTQKRHTGLQLKDLRISLDDENLRGESIIAAVPGEVSKRSSGPLVVVAATATINNNIVDWNIQGKRKGKKLWVSYANASPVKKTADEITLQLQGENDPVALPLFAYFRTNRQLSLGRRSQRPIWDRAVDPRMLAYDGALVSGSNFAMFVDWYMTMFRSLGPIRDGHSVAANVSSRHQPAALLAAVNAAVDTVLQEETGWHGLHWDETLGELLLNHPAHGRLPLSFLSDGIRNTVAMVADVAHRCARLNPQYGEDAPLQTCGILVIDELDLHLHPEWQQSIVRMLRTAFPKLQLIASTHSPQVISTIEARQVRIIDSHDHQTFVTRPEFETQGTESADVLAKVMDVNPTPDIEQVTWLSDYRALIQMDQFDTDAGDALWTKLTDHFQEDHPVIVELEVLRRFQQFKREHNSPSPKGEL